MPRTQSYSEMLDRNEKYSTRFSRTCVAEPFNLLIMSTVGLCVCVLCLCIETKKKKSVHSWKSFRLKHILKTIDIPNSCWRDQCKLRIFFLTKKAPLFYDITVVWCNILSFIVSYMSELNIAELIINEKLDILFDVSHFEYCATDMFGYFLLLFLF